MKVRTTHSRWESDLLDNFTEISAFRQVFKVDYPGVLEIDFKCETKHRNLVNGVVVASARVKYRWAETEAGLSIAPLIDIEGAVGGGNILDITDHYHTISFPAAIPLVSGWYRIEVHMSSGSTIPHANGECARISNQANPAGPFGCYNILRTKETQGDIGGTVTVSVPA